VRTTRYPKENRDNTQPSQNRGGRGGRKQPPSKQEAETT
jgi:hypothetical protein